MENTFSGNAFQFDRVLGVKWFPFLFYLQISFSRKQRERESESEIAPARKEREREEEERAYYRQPTSFNFAGDPETSRHEPTN